MGLFRSDYRFLDLNFRFYQVAVNSTLQVPARLHLLPLRQRYLARTLRKAETARVLLLYSRARNLPGRVLGLEMCFFGPLLVNQFLAPLFPLDWPSVFFSLAVYQPFTPIFSSAESRPFYEIKVILYFQEIYCKVS